MLLRYNIVTEQEAGIGSSGRIRIEKDPPSPADADRPDPDQTTT
jgi:hypothetical protein